MDKTPSYSLSRFDSEAVGFTSIKQSRNSITDCSTQTFDYSCSDAGSQTPSGSHFEGTQTCDDDIPKIDINQYIPALNTFLNKVTPIMIEAIDANNEEFNCVDDTDEDEIVHTKLIQEIKNEETRFGNFGASGDSEEKSIISLAWSNAGNTLAVSYGYLYHEDWCSHAGIIEFYTVAKNQDDKLIKVSEIVEQNCVTAMMYHNSIPALIAYATAGGDIIVRSTRNMSEHSFNSEPYLRVDGSHKAKKVSTLKWPSPNITNSLLNNCVSNTVKRRGASDQVLVTAGSDGTVNFWQVNQNLNIFENMISQDLSHTDIAKGATPDISCMDLYQKRSNDSAHIDYMVIGTKTGDVVSYCIGDNKSIPNSKVELKIIHDSSTSAILDLAFNIHMAGVFASLSTNSEINIYKVTEKVPLKVLCISDYATTYAWIPNNPYLMLLGSASHGNSILKIYNFVDEKYLKAAGFSMAEKDNVGIATQIRVNDSYKNRYAIGDSRGNLYIWDIPITKTFKSDIDNDIGSE